MANIIQAKGKLNGKINSKGSVKGSANPSSGARSYGDLPDKPSINGVEISGDKSAEDYGLKPSDFIVNITKDYMEHTVSADKTYNEISEAYNAGMDCYAEYESQKIPLRYLNPGAAIFINESLEDIDLTTITIQSDGSVDASNKSLQASAENAGLVYAQKTTDQDTLPVNIDEEGFLYTAPPKFTFNLTADTDTQTITADKTYTEIRAAYDAGRVIEGIVPILEDNPIQEMEIVRPDYGNNPKTLFELIVISDNKMTFYSTFYTMDITIDDTNTWTIT